MLKFASDNHDHDMGTVHRPSSAEAKCYEKGDLHCV